MLKRLLTLAICLMPAITQAQSHNTWSRGATRCVIQDQRLNPVYTADLDIIMPARIVTGRKVSFIDINSQSELLYFRDLLLGDLDLQLKAHARFPSAEAKLELPSVLTILALDTSWTWRYVNDTAFRLTLQPGFYGDLEELLGTMDMPVGGFFIKTINTSVSAIAGLTVRWRSDLPIMPSAGLVVQPSDWFRVEATVPSGQVIVHATQRWSGRAFWDWDSVTYRLPDDRYDRRYLAFEGTRLGLGVSHEITPEFRVNADAGLLAGRSMIFGRGGETDVGRSLFVRLGVGGAF